MRQFSGCLAFASCLFTFAHTLNAGSVSLLNPPAFALGGDTTSLFVSDVNGDGRKDLLATTSQASSFSVLIATNNGFFLPAYTVSAPGLVNGVTKIGAADFNGDGHQDVLVLGLLLLLMTGDGAGGFSLSATLNPVIPTSGVRESCQDFAIADFNGDGKPDIAAAFGASHFQLLKNTGAGTFTGTADIPVAPAKLFVGDFTGDGKLDVLYTLSIGSPGLLVGHGDGTFDPPASLNVTFTAGALAAGDFDGDGKLDVVATDVGNSRINLYRGAGGGTFQSALPFPVRKSPVDVAAADLDGDGRDDLAVANRDDGSVTVYFGSATSYLTGPVHWSTTASPKNLCIGDVTSDGIPDLLVGTQGTKEVNLLWGEGARRFHAPASYTVGSDPLKGYTIDSMAVADFDGDGNRDLAVVNGVTTTILWGDGRGGFDRSLELSGYPGGVNTPTSVAAGDLDNEGRPDLAVTLATGPRLGIYTNTGSRTFGSPTFFSSGAGTTQPQYVQLADLNLDGKLDAVVLNQFGSVGNDRGSILGGLGNGQFTTATEAQFGLGSAGIMLATANLGGTARPEIILPFLTGQVLFYPDNNTNSWTAPGTFKNYTTPAAHVITTLDATDLNRDGRPDLAFTDPTNNWVSVSLGQGNGAFATQTDYSVPGAPRWIRARDISGDGMADLITCDSRTNLVSVLVNNQAGGFAAPVHFRVSPFARPLNVLVTDLNHDNKPDVITANGTANTVTVLLNDTDFGPAPALTLNRSGNVNILSWPASGGEFELQFAGALGPGVVWGPLTRLAPVGGYYYITNSTSVSSRFYRLQPSP